MLKKIRKNVIRIGRSRGITIPYYYFDFWEIQGKHLTGFTVEMDKNILLKPRFKRTEWKEEMDAKRNRKYSAKVVDIDDHYGAVISRAKAHYGELPFGPTVTGNYNVAMDSYSIDDYRTAIGPGHESTDKWYDNWIEKMRGNPQENKKDKEDTKEHCQEYIDFRNEHCPELDIDDPRVLLRLDEEIDKLKKELGE